MTELSETQATIVEKKHNILIVDDTLHNLRLLSKVLSSKGYKVRAVPNGAMAISAVQAAPPDLILLDINMPEMSGYEVCEVLKANGNTCHIPVVFISALDEALDKVRAFSVGGVDYITKPFQVDEVLTRVRHQLELRSMQQQLQAQNLLLSQEVEQRRKAEFEVRSLNNQLEARVRERTAALEHSNRQLAAEVRERQAAERQLQRIAFYDQLTGLPNRAQLLQQLARALQQSQPSRQGVALLFINLDRFKRINNSLGYSVADQLLRALAERLRAFLPEHSLLARLRADEFVVLEPVSHSQQALSLAQRVQQLIEQPFRLAERDLFTTARIGIIYSDSADSNPEYLLWDADMAMHQAKQSFERIQLFDHSMRQRVAALLELEISLQRALKEEQFELYYQPIVDLRSGHIAGFEALLRWRHPERGFVSPEEFIRAAEDIGLIIPLGAWVLRSACQQLQLWQQHYPELSISVNLSPKQFQQPSLLHDIAQTLASSQLKRNSLKLEITESAIMDSAENSKAVLQALKAQHIQLSIDDFGTGYSSLSYLHRFPVDFLKIDRSFVSSMGNAEENYAIVATIVRLAQSLNLQVIAEGIEDSAQLQLLQDLACSYGQGYYFAKPLPRHEAEALLAATPVWR